MEKCEKCGKYKRDVFRRAEHGKRLCGKCHHDLLRQHSPTGLVPRQSAPAWLVDDGRH